RGQVRHAGRFRERAGRREVRLGLPRVRERGGHARFVLRRSSGGPHPHQPVPARGRASGCCQPAPALRLLIPKQGGLRSIPHFGREKYFMTPLPLKARVVIIGGGISGCSVAYHLAKLGWTDVVLLERKQLTSGTTWHAAGLIGQLQGSQNRTRLAKYSVDLYTSLEEETGLATGLRRAGSMTVALTEHRREEILRRAGLARALGVDVDELSPAEVKALDPHLNIHGVVAGVQLPGDGQADPANIALALAKGARQRGATIIEQTKGTRITASNGRVTGADWEQGSERGHIAADHVVNCGGMWARDLAAQNGVTLPLHACEHFYVVTENIPGLGQLPVLRMPDESAYYKEDAGKILLGAVELKAKPWGMGGISEEFCFDQLPDDF